MTRHHILSIFIALWLTGGCSSTAGVPTLAIYQDGECVGAQRLDDSFSPPQAGLATLHLTAAKDHYDYHAGETMQFSLISAKSVDVACFYQPTDGSIVKIFPNRFNPLSRLRAGEKYTFPNPLFFTMQAGESGSRETLICLATPESIDDQLPWAENDLVPLPITQLEQVIAQYQKFGGEEMIFQKLTIEVQ